MKNGKCCLNLYVFKKLKSYTLLLIYLYIPWFSFFVKKTSDIFIIIELCSEAKKKLSSQQNKKIAALAWYFIKFDMVIFY